LINQFARLPGVGEKTATRLALYVVDSEEEFAAEFAEALTTVTTALGQCEICGNLSSNEQCTICLDNSRTSQVICVVQGYSDVIAIERTGEYDGRYHVLHGLIKPLDGVGPEELGLDKLFSRVEREDVEEIIVATSPSVEGEATAMYIRNELEETDVKVTRIARGLPMGSEIEYADKATLGRALSAREKL
jgi:recombination protein RecR